MSSFHIPVMLNEVIKYLAVKPGHWYIDCNLGGGGHTEAILKMGGKVLGIDLDPDSISEVTKKFNLQNQKLHGRVIFGSDKLVITQDNFVNLQKIITDLNLDTISGILFDLGVSSYQLETAQRGFSFNLDAPLDMRMDKINQTITAADLVNGLHEGELTELFLKLGEENFSKKIAKKIVGYRKTKKIETTNELAQIITSVRPRTHADRTHPATRVFQALRIAVNDELNSLKEALPQALEVLEPSPLSLPLSPLSFPRKRESIQHGGRLVIISFHSLEDRIVKNYFKDLKHYPSRHPELGSGSIKILTDKPVEPTEEEVLKNPRARSGKLRAIEKIN